MRTGIPKSIYPFLSHMQSTKEDSPFEKYHPWKLLQDGGRNCWFHIKSFGENHKKTVILYGREVVFILAMYFLYQLTYLLVGKLYPEQAHKEVAIRNAHALISLERILGIHSLELSLQALFVQVINNVTLMKLINAFYLGAHLPLSLFFFFHLAYCRTLSSARSKWRKKVTSHPLTAVIVNHNESSGDAARSEGETIQEPLLGDQTESMHPQGDRPSLKHPRILLSWICSKLAEAGNLDISSKQYKQFRWSLVLIHLMFGITIIILPMAPPRMMPEEGYVDTIIMYTRTELTKTEERLGVNPYAAMPSLHQTYALFVGMGYFFFATHRWLRITGFVYTIVVAFVIVITGNHYVLDAVVALLYCMLCVYISSKIVALTSKKSAAAKDRAEDNFEKFYANLNPGEDHPLQTLPAKDDEEGSSGPSPKQRGGSSRVLLDV
jgi:hypothetical protein